MVVLKEVSARHSCQNNAVIFGLNEDTNLTADQIKTNDNALIIQLFTYMNISNDVVLKSNYRIGKYVKNSPKFRPIKLIFDQQADAMHFHNTFWALRKDAITYIQLQKITITKDRTPLQQSQFAEVKKQISLKPLTEQNLWQIRYVGDIPKLIRKKKQTPPPTSGL